MPDPASIPCMVCGRPSVDKFRHCAECLEEVTFELLERRGGVMYVSFAAEV